jgi:hypothetical protein
MTTHYEPDTTANRYVDRGESDQPFEWQCQYCGAWLDQSERHCPCETECPDEEE